MRITFSIGSLATDLGGPSRTVTALARAISHRNAAVHILTCLEHRESLGTELKIASLDCRDKSRNLFGTGLISRQVRAALRSQNCDLIHDNGVWQPLNHAVARAAQREATPRIVSPRGMLEPWSLQQRYLAKRAAWLLYQAKDLHRAAALHATSDMEAVNLRRLNLRSPIAIIANGVEIPSSTGRTRVSRARRALFLSRIHPKKGLLTLISAWSALRPKDWKLIVAGPDDEGHQAVVMREIERLGLAADVEFTGPVDGEIKAQLYRDADLFVLPTHSENFGVVIAEALSYGVPVITTKGAPWSGLATRQCGWWIEIGVGPLTEALRSAFEMSDSQRDAMGARGRHWISEDFGWDRVGQQMLSVYEWILNRASRPDCLHAD